MTELGDFLQSRRARLTPEETGLPTFGGRRRVPGLRREELAQLAGVSADYYGRLEQGRLANVSDEVLNAVARALRLDEGERTHLHNLARPPKRPVPAGQVRPGLRWLLASITGSPAYVLGRHMDIVAWNPLARAVYGVDLDVHDNMARLIFLHPSSRELWTPWEDKANNTVGGLRMQAALYPDDPRMAALVDELSASREFRELWAAHEVWTVPYGTMRLDHPRVGPLELAYEALPVPGAPEQMIITYSAEPGSPSAAAIGELATEPAR
ncbi:helix-turn-helix transcriptional regulator [Umezawaea sp. Da 62-37]|uniref:helix-turn-helix transcriptional regulator n=1 Tax=Umezawaea sp. Da 62-37 TaxID=3075927 RepID=UPI0028F736B9|nr:helix-turn-helix transcriptional regulator [Umezawaea sp. Da 62-37]WNV91474.1 helix-turn-helix transcriptional regulator [Umezawaea sp. Da 62-37]